MKTKLALILTILFAFLQSYGSSFVGKDSVRKEKDYVDNIEILLGLATKVYTEKPEKSLQYAQTALKIAQDHNNLQLQAKTLKIIGETYQRMDFERLSLPYYLKALEITSQLNKPELQAELYIL